MGKASFIFKTLDFMTSLIMNPSHIKEVKCIDGKKYDMYYKDETNNKPVIINIHGGGFMAGDKKYRRYWCEILANNGWFVINANYRLCPAATLMDQIKDIWDIIGKVKSIGKKYNLNTKTIVLTGDSAGAYLASYMIALLTNKELRKKINLEKTYRIKITGALLFCGIYDLVSLIENKKSEHSTGLIKEIAESLTGIKRKTLEEFSEYEYYPYFSVQKFINKNWCPVQIFYSKKDLFVKGQGEMFYKALVDNNIPVRRHYTNKFLDNHCYHLFFLTNVSKSSLKITIDFLDKIKNHISL